MFPCPHLRGARESTRILAGCFAALTACHAGAAQDNGAALTQAEVLAKAARNVVQVVSWEKGTARAALGSGILLQRDYVITQCHVLKNAKRFGVAQGQRRSEARLMHENRRRDLCELVVVTPVHFNPATIRIRWIDDVLVGETVYAVGAPAGRDVDVIKAKIADIRGSGEDKTIRVSPKLGAGYNGGALFDRFGALIGISLLRTDGGEATGGTHVYPVQAFLEAAGGKPRSGSAPKILAADPTWEDQPANGELPAASKQALNSPRPQPAPKLPAAEEAKAAAPPPIREAKAEPSTITRSEARHLAAAEYKKAVKEYLETIVRASTKQVAYPDEAVRARWTGTSSILFKFKAGGDLSESYVDKSSGYATLDVTALLAVRKALADIPPPQVVKDKGMTATVAIAFVLPEN